MLRTIRDLLLKVQISGAGHRQVIILLVLALILLLSVGIVGAGGSVGTSICPSC